MLKIHTTAQKPESAFYQQLKVGAKKLNRKLLFTRLESWATLGVPDLLLADEQGKFGMVELKYTTGNTVSLRPHQVSWLTKHSNTSSWILVKQSKKSDDTLFVFKASDALALKTGGLKSVNPVYSCKSPFDWEKVFSTIC